MKDLSSTAANNTEGVVVRERERERDGEREGERERV